MKISSISFTTGYYWMLVLIFQIYSELKRLARAYDDRIKLIEIGKSYENRVIYGIQVRWFDFVDLKARTDHSHIALLVMVFIDPISSLPVLDYHTFDKQTNVLTTPLYLPHDFAVYTVLSTAPHNLAGHTISLATQSHWPHNLAGHTCICRPYIHILATHSFACRTFEWCPPPPTFICWPHIP